MIQVFYLQKYDWLIKIFYIQPKGHKHKVIKELKDIDCPEEIVEKAEQILYSKSLDEGLTYTDPQLHVSIIIIGESSCPEQFINTYVHEIGHAAIHISEFTNIDVYSEEFQYLQGSLVQKSFSKARQFLCSLKK